MIDRDSSVVPGDVPGKKVRPGEDIVADDENQPALGLPDRPVERRGSTLMRFLENGERKGRKRENRSPIGSKVGVGRALLQAISGPSTQALR